MTTPGGPPLASRSLLRWCFEDRASGKIVVVQWPNLPVLIFLAGTVVQWLLAPTGKFGAAVQVVTALALTWWALDELIRGSNPWRRVLGAAALGFAIYHYAPMLAAAI